MPSVCAVIVTYNRKALLRECLAALCAQTRPPEHVLVVDNASADGTREMVAAEFPAAELLALPDNRGGAGGFHAGLEAFGVGDHDWAWLMDDDTIAGPGALAELLAAEPEAAGVGRPLVLASRVLWSNGALHPMNHPTFKRDVELVAACCERGLLPLRVATFVSLLVHREAVAAHGLPLAHYFIWSDDIEYTARVLRGGPHGFFVPGSVVEHRTRTAHTAITESGGRFYFHVRNSLYMLRSAAWSRPEKLSIVWGVLFTTQAYLRFHALRRESFAVVLRGLRDGLRRTP